MKQVDFTIFSGELLADWLSPNPHIEATVYMRANEIVGFTRIKNTEPTSQRLFMACDEQTTLSMTAQININASKLVVLLYAQSASSMLLMLLDKPQNET